MIYIAMPAAGDLEGALAQVQEEIEYAHDGHGTDEEFLALQARREHLRTQLARLSEPEPAAPASVVEAPQKSDHRVAEAKAHVTALREQAAAFDSRISPSLPVGTAALLIGERTELVKQAEEIEASLPYIALPDDALEAAIEESEVALEIQREEYKRFPTKLRSLPPRRA